MWIIADVVIRDDTRHGDGTKKPWFVIEAANAWAEVGNKATIEAQATGKPMPTFRWYVI